MFIYSFLYNLHVYIYSTIIYAYIYSTISKTTSNAHTHTHKCEKLKYGCFKLFWVVDRGGILVC